MPPKDLFSRKPMLLAATLVCLAAWPRAGLAQGPADILQVDLENVLFYNYDTYDYTKFATNPTRTPDLPMKTFAMHVAVGDVVAVNGKAAKGTFLLRSDPMIVLRPNATPGQAIADITRGMLDDFYLEFLRPDGTSFGSIVGVGTWGGAPAPGAPLAAKYSNYAITGGTGAFLGVRGQAAHVTAGFPGTRTEASIAEDPANRRINGGGSGRLILQLLPMLSPEVVQTTAGPAVVHSTDFSPVSTDKPAKSGEVLTLFATGLGPTQPGLDPGQSFSATPLQLVNAPVDVTVNGTPAEVLYAGGYPGTTNAYQVNFRLPAGINAGTATLQVSTAWIAGHEVKIATQ